MNSEPNPESTDIYDPYISDLFIKVFEDEDNAELARMFAVGLAINDAPAVVPDRPAARSVAADTDQDVAFGVDKDGDQMRASYVEGRTPEYNTDAAIIFRVTNGGFLMPIEHVPGFIAWLNSRVAKHARGQL